MSISNISAGYGYTPMLNNNGVGITTPNLSSNKQAPYPNLAPLDKDTVNFKGQTNQKKKGMSGFAKVCIGALVVVGGAFVAHKIIPPMLVKKRVENIFLDNFTKEEAQTIQKKYQDIAKITDKNKFVDRLVEELKKDYKIDDLNIRVNKNYKAGSNSDAVKAAAIFHPQHKEGYLEILVDTENYGNKELLKHITHELRHAKQDKFIYQCSDKAELIEIWKNRAKAYFPEHSDASIKEFAEEEVNDIYNFYQKLSIPKLKDNDKNYNWARKCMESMKCATNNSQTEYSKAFYETDAKKAENIMQRLINNSLF